MNNKVDHVAFAKQYAENGRPGGDEETTREVGVVGAVNYSYDNRYLADLSYRLSGSSIYGSDTVGVVFGRQVLVGTYTMRLS